MGNKFPKNWIKVSLQDVTKNVKGKKPQIQSETEFEGSIPYMDIKALEFNIIRQFADIKSSKLFEEGDIAMVWDGARSGWVSKTNFGAIGSTLVAFKPVIINSDYLFYYLLDKYPFINSNARGVGIPHVDPTVLWALKFPLPPLAEQNRIVSKLDSLFEQLENIKTSMTAIPVLLKNFRQQVLTQAVTGKLLGVTEFTNFSELEIKIKTGPFGSALHKSDYIDNGIAVINPSHIIKGRIVPDSKISIDGNKFNELKRWKLENNDIILGRRGEMGRAAKYSDELGVLICGTGSLVLKVPKNISPDFLVHFLRSPFCVKFLEENSVGTTMINLNQKIIKSIPFPNLTLEKQLISVKKIENLFAKADAIEQQYKSLKVKIDTLPQAILHKAFKGELSEQLATDGDARELLKQIQELKGATTKITKNTKLEKLKSFNKKIKNYPESEITLDMVAEGK